MKTSSEPCSMLEVELVTEVSKMEVSTVVEKLPAVIASVLDVVTEKNENRKSKCARRKRTKAVENRGPPPKEKRSSII